MVVTFFGHKNSPETIKEKAESVISGLIENHAAYTFYVGNQGSFDYYINEILHRLSKKYPHIKHYTVLAYMPQKNDPQTNLYNSILPEEVATSHPKYAISKRNDWMLKKSDTVIAYITNSHGGAAKYYEKAIRQNKHIINLAD